MPIAPKHAISWLREVRWILAATSPMVGILVAIVSFVAAPTALRRLCSPVSLDSAFCNAESNFIVATALISVGFALAAALFVWLPTTLAPEGKRTVAMVAFLCGCVLIGGVLLLVMPVPAFAAQLSGVLTLFFLRRQHASAA